MPAYVYVLAFTLPCLGNWARAGSCNAVSDLAYPGDKPDSIYMKRTKTGETKRTTCLASDSSQRCIPIGFRNSIPAPNFVIVLLHRTHPIHPGLQHTSPLRLRKQYYHHHHRYLYHHEQHHDLHQNQKPSSTTSASSSSSSPHIKVGNHHGHHHHRLLIIIIIIQISASSAAASSSSAHLISATAKTLHIHIPTTHAHHDLHAHRGHC